VILVTGGADGIRDVGLLDSAVHRLQASFAEFDLYPTLAEKAAALLHSLIMNHPFVDGNKRTAFTAMDVFLRLNNFQLVAYEDDLYELVISIAENRRPFDQIAPWLAAHLVHAST
jgi:death on curing protein